jgi:hypothetical protein
VSGKPTKTSGGLEVKSPTKTQTPETAGVKLEKTSELKEVVEKQNTKLTYAIIRARRNVVISVINKNGFIKVTVNTMLPQRVVSGFDVRHLKKVIIALNDLYNDLVSIKPDLEKQSRSVREY